MKTILQRVNSASVEVENKIVGEIGKGLLLLVGFGAEDVSPDLKKMALKICNMRIFPDQNKKFDRSIFDIEGEVLLVPQFTLFADTRKGRRPEFFGALDPALASPLFDQFVELFKELGVKNVASGIFGAYMKVKLENDGPVTITLED